MKKIIFLGGLLIFLAGCVDHNEAEISQGYTISFSPHVGRTTKAEDVTNSNMRSFFVYGGYDAASPVFNGDAVRKTGNAWAPEESRYWVYGKTYSFAAVGPVEVDATFNLNKFTIENYTPSDDDLVVAVSAPVESKPDNEPVSMNFRHALSKVQVTFKKADVPNSNIEISDVAVEEVLNKGNLTAIFDSGTEIFWSKSSETGNYQYPLSGNQSAKYLLPQPLSQQAGISFHLKSSIDGRNPEEKDYLVKIHTAEVGEWEAGHAYNYIIDLNSLLQFQEISFTVEDIAGWSGEDVENEPSDPVPGPSEEKRNPLADGKLCILAIGNSFSQDAVEQYLYELCKAAGIEAVIGNMYIGGCRLDTHWANAQSEAGAYAYRKVVNGVKTETGDTSLPYGVADEDWDFITFQQASGSSGVYSTYTPYLKNLIDWVSAKSNADLWLHQTWAYSKNSDHAEFPKYDKNQMTMYSAIVECSTQAMADHPRLKGVIPSGTAIQNGRTSFLGDTFNRDGYHLETTYGRYTAACTWFEALTGISAVGNSYAPATINSQQKAIAQNAAHLAVQKPYEVTVLTDFAKPEVSESLSSSLLIDFGGNKADGAWNMIGDPAATDVILTDAEGNYTAATLSIEKPFTSLFNGAGSEPQEKNDITAGGATWPMKAWADSFVISGSVGSDSDEAVIAVSGLDSSMTYDVTVMSARWNGSRSARKTNFEMISASGSVSVQINQGIGRQADFEWGTFNFDELTYTFKGISPVDGVLRLKVSGLEVGSTVVEGNISALCINPK